MNIDEAIRHCEEVAEKNECKMTSDDGYTDVSMKQCAAEHKQLAEWLTELKELKNSIGTVRLNNMKNALKLIRAYKAENIAQKKLIAEYKRLLKSAIDEWNLVCEWGNCGEYCGWFENGKCSQKWSGEAEALKLIGEDEDDKIQLR